jgi:hypothetical protein
MPEKLLSIIGHLQKMNSNKLKIIEIKEKIHDLTEYLNSDICRSCGEVAIQIEKYVHELSLLISSDN